MKYSNFASILLTAILVGCGSPTPTLTSSPPPGPAATATATYLAPNATRTLRPTAESPRESTQPTTWPTPTPAPDYPLVSPDDAALPAGALMRQGIGIVLDSALHPDGAQVALGTSTGVYVYRVPELTQVWRRITAYPVFGISWSPDGTRLLTSYYFYASPTLWTSDGVRLRELDGFLEGQWSPDGSMIAVPYDDGDAPPFDDADRTAMMLFDGHNGVFVRALNVIGSIWTIGQTIHWSPDSTRIALMNYGESGINEWDAVSGKHILQFEPEYFTGLAGAYGFDSTNDLLWATSSEQTVTIMNLGDDTVVAEYQLPPGEYWLSWSRDMQTIYADNEQRTYVIDRPSGSILWNFTIHIDDAITKGNKAVLVNYNGLYIVEGSTLIGSFHSNKREYSNNSSAHWLPDGRLLITDQVGVYLTTDGRIEQGFATTMEMGAPLWTDVDGVVLVRTVDFFEEKYDEWQWNLSTNTLIATGQEPSEPFPDDLPYEGIDFHPTAAGHRVTNFDQQYFYITRADGTYFTIDASIFNDENTYRDFWGMNWSPDGETLLLVFSEGWDADGGYGATPVFIRGLASVWDAQTGSQLRQFTFDPGILAATWSPNGRILALGLGKTGSGYFGGLEDSAIVLVNPFTGEELARLEGHGGAVNDHHQRWWL